MPAACHARSGKAYSDSLLHCLCRSACAVLQIHRAAPPLQVSCTRISGAHTRTGGRTRTTEHGRLRGGDQLFVGRRVDSSAHGAGRAPCCRATSAISESVCTASCEIRASGVARGPSATDTVRLGVQTCRVCDRFACLCLSCVPDRPSEVLWRVAAWSVWPDLMIY